MKVLLFTSGSRGDVQPYVALTKALEAAGHEATLVTPAAWEHFVKRNGVRSGPLRGHYWNERRVDPELLRKLLKKRSSFRAAIKMSRTHKIDSVDPLDEIYFASRGGADVVVHQTLHAGRHIAEWLGVPAVPVCLQPFWIRTRMFPQMDLPVPVPRILNGFSYMWSNWHLKEIERARYGREIVRWRYERLGSRRRYQRPFHSPDGEPRTVLQAFSRHILPGPMDYPKWVHTTGYWLDSSPPKWTPPQQLDEFVAEGEMPVYVGLGSAGTPDAKRTTRMVVEALRQAQVRAVVNISSSGIVAEELGSDVMAIDDVPYNWLFPRMAAVIHAGGPGTGASALASGCPQVICPVFAEQRFWAYRMHASGVSGPPLPDEELTPELLAYTIRRAMTDKAMKECAEEVRGRIRAEDGLTAAVKILESVVESDD